MKNPNRGASKDLLQRYKEASYERMRVELKCSVELLMQDFDITWDDLACMMGMNTWCHEKLRAAVLKQKIIQGELSLNDLNTLAHLFSAEPYIIFRPRLPWIKS